MPLLWKAKVELIEIFFTTGTIPSLLSAAGGWMNSTRYALSDKAARNFRKADDAVTSDDKTGKADLLKSGVQIRVRLVVSAKLPVHVMSDDTSRQVARLVIPDCSCF